MRPSHSSSRYLFSFSSCACATLLLTPSRSRWNRGPFRSTHAQQMVNVLVSVIFGLHFDDRYIHSIFRGWYSLIRSLLFSHCSPFRFPDWQNRKTYVWWMCSFWSAGCQSVVSPSFPDLYLRAIPPIVYSNRCVVLYCLPHRSPSPVKEQSVDLVGLVRE